MTCALANLSYLALSSRVAAVLERGVPNVECISTFRSVCSVKRYGKKAQCGRYSLGSKRQLNSVLGGDGLIHYGLLRAVCGSSLAIQLLWAVL